MLQGLNSAWKSHWRLWRDERLVIVPILTSFALAKFGITCQSGFGRFAARKYLTSDTQIIGSNERKIYTRMLRNFSESSEQNSQLHFATPLWELPVSMMLFSGILLFETIESFNLNWRATTSAKDKKRRKRKGEKTRKNLKMRCILVPRAGPMGRQMNSMLVERKACCLATNAF